MSNTIYNTTVQDSQSTHLRLTRRGKAVFSAFGLGALLAGGLFISAINSTAAEATAEVSGAEFGYVVPMPGESLWQIAAEIAPKADPRDTVADIVALNQLPSSAVQAYEPVAVPLEFNDAERVFSAAEVGILD
ncbi:hypothetical protein [Canibacter zhoujuaniae]|uniref:hypothetical protein n=1 Tax=Canibacter zhoujuaniae TaxID=2708343 RepID=UPI00141ECFE6|nr:hypothetical protein [Canibacter zhoujuaniae]